MTGVTDTAQLRASVEALDPIVALLCLVQITGERGLLTSLGHVFDGTPRAGRSSFAGPGAAAAKIADPAVVADIRERLIKAVQKHPTPLLMSPGKALFKQMAELCLGQPLDPAACEMGREQAGFAVDVGAFEPTRIPPDDFNVLVVGGGMVGINAAVKLKAAGFKFRVIERREEVGGTWSINTYPNAAVDTPSVQYSFSFELNASWTKYYPRGPEYLAYLKQVATKYDIVDRIDFNTAMEKCEWDHTRQLWTVTCTRNGRPHVYEANVVISALGFLNRPSYPDVEGLDRFKGPVIHSARWDGSLDLTGKTVVVVGTGATAAQLATAAATEAGHLTVIQRQPNYMLQDDKVMQDVGREERWALENVPFVLQWQRFQSLSTLMTLPNSMAKIDAEWRARTGGVSPLNDAVRQLALSYIETKFADRPDLKAKVTPDFPFFAKRPILDCGYFDTLKKPNVTLVEGTLARCEENAVILKDGTRIECDTLLLATGFKLDFLSGFDIRGRGGRTIQSAWTPYPRAYMGLEVPGFPNFFITCGPNTALTASHTTTGEQQVFYIVEALKLMVEENAVEIEVKPEAYEAYATKIHHELDQTVWVNHGTAHGYYRHESGKVIIGYPGPNIQYWKALRQPVLDDHVLTTREPQLAEARTAVV